MATISMKDLLETAGNDANVTITSHSNATQNRKTKVGERPGRPVSETKALIKKCIEDAERPCSIAEICTYLERGATPHIRNILKGMVDAGELIETADLARSRTMVRYWYSLP